MDRKVVTATSTVTGTVPTGCDSYRSAVALFARAEVGEVGAARELLALRADDVRRDRHRIVHRVDVQQLFERRALALELEPPEDVGHAVRLQARRPVHELEVEMRAGRGSGVAGFADHLARQDVVAHVDRDSAGPQVGVEREHVGPELDDVVAVGLFDGDRLLVVGDLVEETVDGGSHDLGVGNRDHRLAVGEPALVQTRVAGGEEVVGVEAVEVDREPLREPFLPVDGLRGAAMRSVAARAHCQPTRAGPGSADDHRTVTDLRPRPARRSCRGPAEGTTPVATASVTRRSRKSQTTDHGEKTHGRRHAWSEAVTTWC
jgi:hypothetical protein